MTPAMTPLVALITHVALGGQVYSAPPTWFDSLQECNRHQQNIMKTSDTRHFPVVAACVPTPTAALPRSEGPL
jgi:hypothetical protein